MAEEKKTIVNRHMPSGGIQKKEDRFKQYSNNLIVAQQVTDNTNNDADKK